MGFEDLPREWVDLPLDDPQLVGDVLDLVVSLQDRLDGGLALLVCDAEHRLVLPCVISDLDYLAPEHQRRRALGPSSMRSVWRGLWWRRSLARTG
jgi:hypothetical protein